VNGANGLLQSLFLTERVATLALTKGGHAEVDHGEPLDQLAVTPAGGGERAGARAARCPSRFAPSIPYRKCRPAQAAVSAAGSLTGGATAKIESIRSASSVSGRA
jgi:hypothetical protein